jgi:cyclopropane fatty-acyl-phospholipid synthase-like methyltransferase
VVGVLGTLYSGGAQELAAILSGRGMTPAGAAVLDVGAGSGVWSIAVAANDERATLTAVDREQVLEMTRTYARAAGLEDRLTGIAGDWRDAPLAEAGFDLAFLANVCHLEPDWEVREMIKRMYTALRPGGVLAIVDTIPNRFATGEPRELFQGLTLGLRTPGGGVHDRSEYTAWMEAAGVVVEDAIVLRATDSRLTALLARRP